MTKNQKEAIEQMNKALARLHRCDIEICGMDTELFYATAKAIRERVPEKAYSVRANYNYVADAYYQRHKETGKFNSPCYVDSGGW